MENSKQKAIADKLFSKVKNLITEGKNRKKDAQYYYIKAEPVSVNLGIGYKFGWFGAKDERYVIYLEGDAFEEFTGLYDLKGVIHEFFKLADAQKKVRGWGNLEVARDRQSFGSGWCNTEVIYPSKVILPDAPCNEFISLKKYLTKYGKDKYGRELKINDFEFFSAHMGGKRGVLWGEEGSRHFLANKAKKCETILADLREKRGTKDIMTCIPGEEDYIEEADRRYSQYHETECDGERRHFLEITIKTPQGKVKYLNKIY